MNDDAVRDYYASFGEREWHRLDTAEGSVEFVVNTHFLERYLPPQGRVLDIGGGPGRYAAWLADRGHRVVLADLSPELLDIARHRLSSPLVEEVTECDARDLSRWDDETFDAAVVLGPLYHLPDPNGREQAVREAVRVVSSGGVLFFALMTWFGLLRRTIALADERHRLTSGAFMGDLLERGVFTNDVPGRFTHGWGARPAEIAPWFEQFGLATLALASSEGLASGIEPALAELQLSDSAAFERVCEVVMETATDPSLFGLAKHLLYVGRRP